ncbi:hypothetical protein OHS70_18545 [Streptomyces sp. NBC_00390]
MAGEFAGRNLVAALREAPADVSRDAHESRIVGGDAIVNSRTAPTAYA